MIGAEDRDAKSMACSPQGRCLSGEDREGLQGYCHSLITVGYIHPHAIPPPSARPLSIRWLQGIGCTPRGSVVEIELGG